MALCGLHDRPPIFDEVIIHVGGGKDFFIGAKFLAFFTRKECGWRRLQFVWKSRMMRSGKLPRQIDVVTIILFELDF
jgi:hypothetical protein